MAAQARRQRDRGTGLPPVVSGTGCTAVPGRRPASRAGLAVLVAVVALALAACAGPLKPVALPHKSPLPSLPAPSPSPTESSAQQQVMDTMVNFNAAELKAEMSKDADQVRTILSPYLPADAVTKTVTLLTSIWSKGEIFYGDYVSHVLRVTVDGTTAIAYDCDDNSNSGLKYAASGKIVPGSQGVADLNVDTHMSLEGHHWMIVVQNLVDKPCEP
jgi:hypothetical protein